MAAAINSKSAEERTWDSIFSTINFDCDPPVKYIKGAVIQTKSGKKIKLTGQEYANVMEQERQFGPAQGVVKSCRVTLDFEKLKTDIDRFANTTIKKISNKYRKSREQVSWNTKLKKMSIPKSSFSNDDSKKTGSNT